MGCLKEKTGISLSLIETRMTAQLGSESVLCCRKREAEESTLDKVAEQCKLRPWVSNKTTQKAF